MEGRTVLVTGASGGIGLAASRRLAGMGAEVLLACRDRARGEAALAGVAGAATGAAPALLLADLSIQAEVRRLAAEVRGRWPRLDVLLNNAGAAFARRELTADGIERTLATNHLAPFLLTQLLAGPLRAATGGARVVTVASRLQADAIDWDDPGGERRYRSMRAYAQSKLANVLFTFELARRLEGTGVTANCLAPGLVRTNFGGGNPGPLGLLPRLLKLLPMAIPPEAGADTPVYLASSPEVAGVTGRYFVRRREARAKPAAYDRGAARRLWELSARLARLEAGDGWGAATG